MVFHSVKVLGRSPSIPKEHRLQYATVHFRMDAALTPFWQTSTCTRCLTSGSRDKAPRDLLAVQFWSATRMMVRHEGAEKVGS
jgi:hypothetical protein